ncbi:MAG: arsenate reductase ArsC [Rhodospirillales bacterium]|nr:arsenate reductase ArsC [Rhodospirillales bacterium]
MPARPLNVLFLCTGNSARSLIAESLLGSLGGGRFRAFSAGSRPAGAPNPLALEVLRRHGLATAGLRSKSWDEFAREGAPAMDLIFTVCDNAAAEPCPVWPGHPATAHWGFPDPAAAQGAEAERRAAMIRVFAGLRARIGAFLALPVESLSGAELKARLAALGKG